MDFLASRGDTDKTVTPYTIITRVILGMCLFVGPLLFSGCAYQQEVLANDLPNQIFTHPKTNPFGSAKVGVFAFSGPDYAPQMGRMASQIFCDELQTSGAFREVTFQPDILNMTMGNVIDTARIKGYDLIVTGKLLHYFEGSAIEASRVSQELQIIRVRGGKPRILWHARSSEIGPPVKSKDFIFFLSDGKPAPSPAALMRKNAERFCRMILTVPPRKGPGYRIATHE